MSSAIVDEVTGELLGIDDGEDSVELCHAYRLQAAGLKRDVEGLERELRAANRKIGVLDEELKKQRMEAPEAAVVRTIFNAWVEATGRNPKRTKLGAVREKVILARLREGHDAERVLRAVTIGAKAANTSDRDAERVALIAALKEACEIADPDAVVRIKHVYKTTRGKESRFDDIELICRSEVLLERFADLADRLDPEGAKTPGMS